MIKPIVFILLLTYFSVSAFATHILGATISYKYISSTTNDVTYRVTLDMYRDCRGGVSSTVQFAPEINIGIYHNTANKVKYKTEKIKILSKRIVNISGCYSANFCVEQGFYEKIITFDKSSVGYYLVHEVCCRNELTNVKNNGGIPENGYTFLCLIPPTSITNNSPVFNFLPTIVYGINKTNEDSWGANDTDGDSLVYTIATPYKGGNPSMVEWEPPAKMVDLVSVDYVSGYSFSKPFGSSGNISIDPVTGQFSFSNTTTGSYAYCVEIMEYRKGILIGRHRKDYPLIFINTPPENGYKINLLKPFIIDNKTVRLSWQVCPNTFPTYTIERKTKFGLFNKIGTTSRRDTTNNISHSTWYFYRVKAMINSVEVISNIDSVYINPASIISNASNLISIYPNPVKDYLNIDYPSLTFCSIYDVTGRLLLESIENTSVTKLDIRLLNPGLYFIALKTEKGIITQRFIKE